MSGTTNSTGSCAEYVEYCQQLQEASSRSLTQFTESLDETEMKTIVRQYLFSKLEKTLSPSDAAIFDKFHRYLETKHLHTQHAEFTIPMELLAYTFSFLSYNELCACAPTCSFFLFTQTRFPKLAHHHVQLTHHLVVHYLKMMTQNPYQKLPLKYFHHIVINCAYHSGDSRQNKRADLYDQFIESIIQTSLDTLETLHIAIPNNLRFGDANFDKKIILQHILNTFDTFPELRTLKWEETLRIVNPITIWHALTEIESSIGAKLRQLDTFHMMSLQNVVVIPKLANLRQLNLEYYACHLFCPDRGIIAYIADNLPQLVELNISGGIDRENEFPAARMTEHDILQTSRQNLSVQRISIRFALNPTFKNTHHTLDSLIARVFVTFPNIVHFEYDFLHRRCYLGRRSQMEISRCYQIKWADILRILFKQKHKLNESSSSSSSSYIDESNLISKPLSVFKLNQISRMDAYTTLSDLQTISSQYFQLRHFKMNVVTFHGINASQLRVLFGCMLQFLQRHPLLSILEFCSGNGYAHTLSRHQSVSTACIVSIDSLIEYGQYVELAVKSLTSLQNLHLQFSSTKPNTAISKHLSQVLSQLESNKILKSIVLDNVSITPKYRAFLQFWFKSRYCHNNVLLQKHMVSYE